MHSRSHRDRTEIAPRLHEIARDQLRAHTRLQEIAGGRTGLSRLQVGRVLLDSGKEFMAGMAAVAEELLQLMGLDVVLLAATHENSKQQAFPALTSAPFQLSLASCPPTPTQLSTSPGAPLAHLPISHPYLTHISPISHLVQVYLSLIGRASARAKPVDLNALMRRWEGGGPRIDAG